MFSAVYRITQKDFLCTSVHFNVGPCCSSTDVKMIFNLLPRVYQHVRCYKLGYRLDICRATTGAHIEVYGCA
jgi:hypothetical protein